MRLAYESVESEGEWWKDVRACKIKRWSKERVRHKKYQTPVRSTVIACMSLPDWLYVTIKSPNQILHSTKIRPSFHVTTLLAKSRCRYFEIAPPQMKWNEIDKETKKKQDHAKWIRFTKMKNKKIANISSPLKRFVCSNIKAISVKSCDSLTDCR